MAAPAIQVEGLDSLRRQLRQVKDKELDAEMKAIHLAIASEVIHRAKQLAPVKTGRLRDSLRGSGTVRDAVGRAGRSSVPYAPAVHWGHGSRNLAVVAHGTQARHAGRKSSGSNPFLRNAAIEVERHITDRYERDVHRMLDRIVKDTLA